MSSNYGVLPENFYFDDDFPDAEWGEDAAYGEAVPYEEPYEEYDAYEWGMEDTAVPSPFYANGFLIVGILFIALMVMGVAFQNRPVVRSDVAVADAVEQVDREEMVAALVGEATAVIAPYKDYRITQGLHGQSYGHLAIDLAAGRGEPISSPINGRIASHYIDEYGNSTLLIENDVYIVTLLHGEYAVEAGDVIEIGQQIGVESNRGYTKDMMGNLCYERDYCGNHTHISIYDKRIQANVNPLDLISSTPLFN